LQPAEIVSAEKFIGVTLAKILRPRGLRGEVVAAILTDFPERLPKLKEAWLSRNAGESLRLRVLRCWFSTGRGGQAIFQFAGVDSVEAAESLRGMEIQVPLERRAALGEGNYYVSDLVGCEVWESGASTALGSVRDVDFPGGVPLLAVETKKGEILVPLAAEICLRVDVPAKRIEVALPEGLADLNRA
jgi:16S rRNA processing protein RimM